MIACPCSTSPARTTEQNRTEHKRLDTVRTHVVAFSGARSGENRAMVGEAMAEARRVPARQRRRASFERRPCAREEEKWVKKEAMRRMGDGLILGAVLSCILHACVRQVRAVVFEPSDSCRPQCIGSRPKLLNSLKSVQVYVRELSSIYVSSVSICTGPIGGRRPEPS